MFRLVLISYKNNFFFLNFIEQHQNVPTKLDTFSAKHLNKVSEQFVTCKAYFVKPPLLNKKN